MEGRRRRRRIIPRSLLEREMNDDKILFYSSMIGCRRKLLRSTWLVKALFVDVLSLQLFAAEWLSLATTFSDILQLYIYLNSVLLESTYFPISPYQSLFLSFCLYFSFENVLEGFSLWWTSQEELPI